MKNQQIDCYMTNGTIDNEIGTLTVNFLNVQDDEMLAESIPQLIRKIAKCENRPIEAVNIIVTDDAKLISLNKRYADEDHVTDVLAFDLRDSDCEGVEGDIYISIEQALEQSIANDVDLHNEVLRLVVHGFLHLCGYDHSDDVSLGLMRNLGEKYIDES